MTNDLNSLVQHHPRDFSEQRYVYPVISRRAHGVSIGVNLSPTGLCNFQCVYCQVDGNLRLSGKPARNRELDLTEGTAKVCCVDSPVPMSFLEIDLSLLEDELRRTLALALNGELFKAGSFSRTPLPMRRVNDIAFSGNGEPTLSPQFFDVAQIVVKVRNELGAFGVKPVVITNATRFHKADVSEALDLLAENGGEIWAKLDAGTHAYYQQVDRSQVPFQTIIDNIANAAKRSPIVIQTLLIRMHGEPMPEAELLAYMERLHEITQQGGQIKLVQFHTIARATAEPWVTPLDNQELDAFAGRVRNETCLPVETFYGK